jgi:hypothetical protein
MNWKRFLCEKMKIVEISGERLLYGHPAASNLITVKR